MDAIKIFARAFVDHIRDSFSGTAPNNEPDDTENSPKVKRQRRRTTTTRKRRHRNMTSFRREYRNEVRNRLQSLFFQAVLDDDVKWAKDLLKGRGVRINRENYIGETPLSLARSNKMVRLLLAKGAHVDEPTMRRGARCTPLYVACEKPQLNLALFVSRGANAYTRSTTGKTSVVRAKQRSHPDAPLTEHAQKLVLLVQASQQGKLDVDVRWIRAMRNFFYVTRD
jgi:hypothetical protein